MRRGTADGHDGDTLGGEVPARRRASVSTASWSLTPSTSTTAAAGLPPAAAVVDAGAAGLAEHRPSST